MSNELHDEPLRRLGDPIDEAPARFWMRFSLRSLLIVTVLAGLTLAWMGVRQRRTTRQLAVVEELRPYGASPGVRDGNVVQLAFSGASFRNDVLEHLRELPHVERIVLIDTAANDETLQLIKSTPNLRELLVMNANVTDEGLQHLRGLTKLEVLWLASTHITDDGLQHVEPLTALRRLNLSESQIGDEGLEHLRRLTSLQKVYLRDTQVSDDGVDSLRQSLPNTNFER